MNGGFASAEGSTEVGKKSARPFEIEEKDASRKQPICFRYLTPETEISSILSPAGSAHTASRYTDDASNLSLPLLDKYADPHRWQPTRKAWVTWLCCISTVVTTYTPGAYVAGLPQYKREWDISSTAVYGGITTFTLCFAIAPMVLAPFSELQGRRPVFLLAGAVYVVSQIGSAVTRSFAGLLLTRAVAGVSCSVFSTMVGGVISDIYVAKDRNTAMSIFSGAAIFGSGLGPMVSSAVAEHISWRWIYYVQTISCGLVVGSLFLFFPETRGSVLLSRKAKIINAWYDRLDGAGYHGPMVDQPSSDGKAGIVRVAKLRWKVKADEERATLGVMIKTSLSRPLHLLFTESIVFWFSLWMAFAWTILYLTFELLPLMFVRAYGFSAQAAGFVFAAISVASIVGAVVGVCQDHKINQNQSFLSRLGLQGQPEARLIFACGQSLLLPVGLIWLGTTVRPAFPWPIPVVSVGCITLGIFSIYLAVFNYLADSYDTYASSAIAAQSFTRNVFAACTPLATEPMFDRLGSLGIGCLLGGVGLLLYIVPWTLLIWGHRIRARSKIAARLASC